MKDRRQRHRDGRAEVYDAIRPAFQETGSPRLGGGLNIGARLFRQFQTDPGLRDRVRHIVTHPQYWGFRLTSVAATDVTSLGCHTDLWNPYAGKVSSLVERLGVGHVLAPTRKPGDVLGPILADVAARTGLAVDTPVYCGIHDSNASLLALLLARQAPFSVVSTGTWVIAMAIGGAPVTLDPERDTLVNVNAFADPVPSARFMGGREHDLLMQGEQVTPSDDDIAAVLQDGTALLPAVIPDTGPFQGRQAQWVAAPPPQGSGQHSACIGFYLAMVTSHCLDLIGHRGIIYVEGPFARNRCYLEMLASASANEVHPMTSATGTSEGAALLGHIADAKSQSAPRPGPAVTPSRRYAAYARRWNEHLEQAAPRRAAAAPLFPRGG